MREAKFIHGAGVYTLFTEHGGKTYMIVVIPYFTPDDIRVGVIGLDPDVTPLHGGDELGARRATFGESMEWGCHQLVRWRKSKATKAMGALMASAMAAVVRRFMSSGCGERGKTGMFRSGRRWMR